MMRKTSLAAAVAVCTLSLAGMASAQTAVIADYGDDFNYPTPSTGWSYKWNQNGPIGTATNYVNLVPDFPGTAATGRYEAIDNDQYPEPPGPAGASAVTATTMTPGRGTGLLQDSNTIPRFVIAGYTIQAQDLLDIGLPANGTGFLTLSSYAFIVGASADGITAEIYKNDTPFIIQGLPPGTPFTSETPGPRSGPIPLGPFQAGDTFYVAIGADPSNPISGDPIPGNDIGDQINLDYTLTLSVPEPTGLAVLGFGLVAGAMRRRRRAI